MSLPQTQQYIASNPRFTLKTAAWPKVQDGQMTIVYMCLQPFGSVHSLDELVRDCISRNYRSTLKNPNTDIPKSVLYHLNLLEKDGSIQEVCRPFLRVLQSSGLTSFTRGFGFSLGGWPKLMDGTHAPEKF
jgi:hypothetical protein